MCNKTKSLGNVYFIKDNSNGLIKIGYAKDVNKRFKTFQTANANLTLLYIIPNCTMDYEKSLHRYFSNVRKIREWFEDFNGVITYFIKRDKLTKKVMREEGII